MENHNTTTYSSPESFNDLHPNIEWDACHTKNATDFAKHLYKYTYVAKVNEGHQNEWGAWGCPASEYGGKLCQVLGYQDNYVIAEMCQLQQNSQNYKKLLSESWS